MKKVLARCKRITNHRLRGSRFLNKQVRLAIALFTQPVEKNRGCCLLNDAMVSFFVIFDI